MAFKLSLDIECVCMLKYVICHCLNCILAQALYPALNQPGVLFRIPFEVKIPGDKEPIYEFTLEDLGRYNDQPVLPFNAYGTLAMARAEFDNNSASSQVFFLLKESELTPSGANLLDGRYAVFGYVVDGQDLLGDMKVRLLYKPWTLSPELRAFPPVSFSLQYEYFCEHPNH